MDEREKIKFRIELGIQDHGEIFHRELIKALKREKNRFSTEEMDKTLVDCIADALIAANIGDVTEWKHRAEVAERAFDNIMKNFHDLLSAMFPNIKIIDLDRWKKDNLANAEKELEEEKGE